VSGRTPGFSERSAAPRDVWHRYAAYLRKPPLLTIEWHDEHSPARGWLVVNSLRGGAAGGGTRMRPSLIRREVVYLAKTMELKFVFSGPPIGGAKAGIDFDPADPRREAVLGRWFEAMAPHLRSCFGTGGDLNVDEVLDVIPCCSRIGLAHPQEGIVRGHMRAGAERLSTIFSSLDDGLHASGEVLGETTLSLADLVTGFGLARSIVHLFERRRRSIEGTRVVIEGFGAVGGPCALYLSRAGARVVGIADHLGALVEPAGLRPEQVEELLSLRRGKLIPRRQTGAFGDRDAMAGVPADLFVAAAASETLDEPRLDALHRQGIRTIACGANQPFREIKLGSTRVQRMADSRFAVLPDVVANCGMARAFSYLMEHPAPADPDAVFSAVDETVRTALDGILERGAPGGRGLLAATLAFALDRVESASSD
jgi:glutamate dehydrogenase/leucine dehydrogenase